MCDWTPTTASRYNSHTSKKHGTADAARFQRRTRGVVVDGHDAGVGVVWKAAAGGADTKGAQESDREKLASLVDEVIRLPRGDKVRCPL